MAGMKIKDLKPGMKNTVIEALVKNKEVVTSSTKPLARALIEDDTGGIILNLWRDQIGQVRVGDRIRVKEGFVKVWKGMLELNTWSAIEKISVPGEP
jgi:ssDNA-binding replication factor A large subunit